MTYISNGEEINITPLISDFYDACITIKEVLSKDQNLSDMEKEVVTFKLTKTYCELCQLSKESGAHNNRNKTKNQNDLIQMGVDALHIIIMIKSKF